MTKRDRAKWFVIDCRLQLQVSTRELADAVTNAVKEGQPSLPIYDHSIMRHAILRAFLLRVMAEEDRNA